MSYVTKLITDDWRGVYCDETEIEFPSSTQIEQAIEKLDGERFTMVTLNARGTEAHLAIGGGSGERYVVYATFDNFTFYNLRETHNSQQVVSLIIGGQEGEYPKNKVVGKRSAITAALKFARDGILAKGLDWEEE